jgi:hypothetical protein
MESMTCSVYVYEMVMELAADHSIELHLLMTDNRSLPLWRRILEKVRSVGLTRFASIVIFNIIETIEQAFLRRLSDQIARGLQSRELDGAEFTSVTHLRSVYGNNNTVKFGREGLRAARSLRLNLIVRGNSRGIFKGKILSVSSDGILSFHHGDNRWNRGGPPGFWEVYRRVPATGFVVQVLTERLDGGKVIFRGETRTRGTYTQNMISVYQVSNPTLAKLIRGYARTRQLPMTECGAPFANRLLKTPSAFVSAIYMLQVAKRYSMLGFKRVCLRKRQRWHVAYVRSPWTAADLGRAVVVENPKNGFFADPFVVAREHDFHIFVEDFRADQGRGVISAIRVHPDDSCEYLPGLVVEPFHLSFPYVFQSEGTWYMIPESREAGSIRLYKCERFPDVWVHEVDLMANVQAVDTLVFERGGEWCMLTSLSGSRAEECGPSLHAFFADSFPSTHWRAHPSNPVLFSAAFGRNAGLLSSENGLYRVRQRYGFNHYGAGSSIARVTRLDREAFCEEEFSCVQPTFMQGLNGTHHLHCDGDVTVVDFSTEERMGAGIAVGAHDLGHPRRWAVRQKTLHRAKMA